jgi:hypothetical protein
MTPDFIKNLVAFFSSERGENLLIGIISSLVATVIAVGFPAVYKWYRTKKGLLTGCWIQLINDGDVIKQDEVTCRQLGYDISGYIKRKEPNDQIQKKWKFIGRIHGEKVFIVFWSLDHRINPDSYGTIQLHVKSDVELRGFYTKAISELDTHRHDQHLSTFKTIPLIWRIRDR